MNLKSILCLTIAAVLGAPLSLRAEAVRISQIDAGTLLFDQDVRAYVSVTDETGRPVRGLTRRNFRLYESKDGAEYLPVQITDFDHRTNYEDGIRFLLLIDNSGSMYRRHRDSNGLLRRRIESAREAVRDFLGRIDPERDRVALVSYNTFYTRHADFTADWDRLHGALEQGIVPPSGVDGYTELYASLHHAVEDLEKIGGRRVIIVLSDGENRPLHSLTNQAHPRYGTKVWQHTEPLEAAERAGISVFTINYGTGRFQKDRRLAEISRSTGGAVFDAGNSEELAGVYASIAGQIRNEYLLTYRASMLPADKRLLKVSYGRQTSVADAPAAEAERLYYAGTVFGLPLESLTPLLLLPLLLALLAFFLLPRLNFEHDPGPAGLYVLDPGGARNVTPSLKLNGGRTIIGSAAGSDLTIHGGVTRLRPRHAAVLYDRGRDAYTLVSREDVLVNNKPARQRRLESGDVINVEGTTIVFDDGRG